MATDCRSMCAMAPRSPQDNDLSTHAHACIQVHNVLVVHANTSVRDEPADRSRIIRAVAGVLTATAKCAAPIGLEGLPPGMTGAARERSLLIESGACQAGLIYLPSMDDC